MISTKNSGGGGGHRDTVHWRPYDVPSMLEGKKTRKKDIGESGVKPRGPGGGGYSRCKAYGGVPL